MKESTNTPILSPTTYSRSLDLRKLPSDNIDVWVGRFPSVQNLVVCWHTPARVYLLSHCFMAPQIEVGGVLLGNIYRSPGSGSVNNLQIDFIEITASIKAKYTRASRGELEFTQETWVDINRVRDRYFSDKQIVGWYHTHPGHGVMLSGKDLYIQNNFFPQDYRLALVIETKENKGAFFLESVSQKGPFQSEVFCWDTDPDWLSNTRIIFRAPGPSTSPGDPFIISNLQDGTTPDISISEEELDVSRREDRQLDPGATIHVHDPLPSQRPPIRYTEPAWTPGQNDGHSYTPVDQRQNNSIFGLDQQQLVWLFVLVVIFVLVIVIFLLVLALLNGWLPPMPTPELPRLPRSK